MIRAIIVDDEPLARGKIELFAKNENDVSIVQLCANGFEAIEAIRKHNPDLLFLDIQMPEMTGFQLLEKLAHAPMPKIIFTTAYDEFALRAFEFHAVDYLLKPFDKERFSKAVEHVRESLKESSRSDATTEQLQLLLHSLKPEREPLQRIVVKIGGRIIFLKMNDIDWIEAAGNNVKLHIGNESHLLRDTMNNFEQQLEKTKFLRIHRSTIVNIDRIKEMQSWFNGEYKVVLYNHTELILSRSYRENVNILLGKEI